jgi:hypothetical protein
MYIYVCSEAQMAGTKLRLMEPRSSLGNGGWGFIVQDG